MILNIFVFFLVSLWIQFALINKKLESIKDKNKQSFERKWNELEKTYR